MIARSPDEIRSLVSSGKWKRKHLEALRHEFGDEALFEALFSAFVKDPPLSYSDQVAPGDFLLEFKPRSEKTLSELIRASLRGWNLSIEQLPFYFREVFGIDEVRSALDRIEADPTLTVEERKPVETYRYWLRLSKGPRRQ